MVFMASAIKWMKQCRYWNFSSILYLVSERVILYVMKVYCLVQISYNMMPWYHNSTQKTWGHVDLVLTSALPQQSVGCSGNPCRGIEQISEKYLMGVCTSVQKSMLLSCSVLNTMISQGSLFSFLCRNFRYRHLKNHFSHTISCLKCISGHLLNLGAQRRQCHSILSNESWAHCNGTIEASVSYSGFSLERQLHFWWLSSNDILQCTGKYH